MSASTSRSRRVRCSSGPSSRVRSSKLRDERRVDDGLAGGDTLERGDEVVEVEHALLEQVADPPASAFEQPERVLGLDVLREDQHADAREAPADLLGDGESLVASRSAACGCRRPRRPDAARRPPRAARPAVPTCAAPRPRRRRARARALRGARAASSASATRTGSPRGGGCRAGAALELERRRRGRGRGRRARAGRSRARGRRRRRRRRRRRPATRPFACDDADTRRARRARTWRRSRAPPRRGSRRRPRPAAGGARSGTSTIVTGTGERSASDRSAAPRPCSVSTAGWMPRASSRSSSSAARSSASASARSSAAPFASGPSFARASCSASPSESSRCCAPSWRSRSSRRRSSSPALTMRAREARSSASCARSSACSRSFSSASRAAAPAALSSARRSSRTRVVDERRDRGVGRAEHGHGAVRPPASGARTDWPDASTYDRRSGSQSASSSGRVAERPRERVANRARRRALELDHEVGDARAGAPAPEQAGGERHRDGERRGGHDPEPDRMPRRVRVHRPAEDRELDDELDRDEPRRDGEGQDDAPRAAASTGRACGRAAR